MSSELNCIFKIDITCDTFSMVIMVMMVLLSNIFKYQRFAKCTFVNLFKMIISILNALKLSWTNAAFMKDIGYCQKSRSI